jgi:arginine decarboxylase
MSDPVAQNRRRYAIDRWSEGLFHIDHRGRMVVSPATGRSAALPEVVEAARKQGLRLPMMLRFPQILETRAGQLMDAFDAAIDEHGYQGRYQPVYPIKVNQQSSVVRTLAAIDRLGLEVGSKPELITALAVSRPGATIICNGYKDAAYIRLA